MSPITGFAYTILSNKKLEDGRKMVVATLAAGNGSLTYPSGGIPVSAGGLGLPSGQIDSLDIIDQGADGYVYTWVKSSGKILSQVESETSAHVLQQTDTSVTPTIALTVQVIGY